MLRRLLLAAVTLFALGTLPAAHAQVEVTLGEEKALRIIPDVDKIDTRSLPGKFRAIRVYALDGSAVDIAKIDIVYEDGSKFTEDRGRPIRLNEKDVRTRLIGPENGTGPEKFIDHIVLHYRTAPGEQQRARVRVAGIASPSGARAVRAAASESRPGSAAAAPTQTPASSAAVAAAGGDVLFGVQTVGFNVDRDVIRVGTEVGKFDKVRLRVLDSDIFLNELRIVYANGEPDILAVGTNIAANTRTKWFELKGDRFIREIQLVYRTKPGYRGQARVEVYGEYAEGWFGSAVAGGAAGQITYTGDAFKHGANRGWLYLGGQQPKFVSVKKGLGYENEVVSVHRNRGFNRFRLDVKDRAITLNKLTIVYGDNSNDAIEVGKAIEAGSSFTVPSLKPKPIKEVLVSYRSRIFDRKATSQGYAFVEFWAQ
jgi:hypothetical protein